MRLKYEKYCGIVDAMTKNGKLSKSQSTFLDLNNHLDRQEQILHAATN